jgi:PDZ domain-containing protein
MIVVLLLLGVWAAIAVGAKRYYAFSPGSAPRITDSPLCRAAGGGNLVLPGGTPCARITVPPGHGHGIEGALNMVDVLVGPATPGQYILSKVGLLHTFDSGVQLVPSGAVLGSTPPSQLSCQDAQQMEGSTSTAAVVGLRQLGYQVPEKDLGAQVYQVAPGTPAAAAGMRCNDVVTAVNDIPIHTSSELVAAIHAAKPGQTVRITVRRTGHGGQPEIKTLSVTLSATPAVPGKTAPSDQAFLGVVASTQTIYAYPFEVTISVGGIGGPSAGLALTLGVVDLLSNGDLTGGHHVAATGTINLDGTVGDVGGVAQKTVAVRRAGAQVFFVPPQELKTAESEAGSMKVYAVSTLDQALADLEALGGHVPPPPAQPVGG